MKTLLLGLSLILGGCATTRKKLVYINITQMSCKDIQFDEIFIESLLRVSLGFPGSYILEFKDGTIFSIQGPCEIETDESN